MRTSTWRDYTDANFSDSIIFTIQTRGQDQLGHKKSVVHQHYF
jgi:hypothetical protein